MIYGYKYGLTNKYQNETTYPYKALDLTCQYNSTLGVAKTTNYGSIAYNSVSGHMQALQRQPLGVAL
jgi:hypothetical protein